MYFKAENIHIYIEESEKLNPDPEVMCWLKNSSVNVECYFNHLTCNFAGREYDSALPPKMYFPNANNCKEHATFIKETLSGKIKKKWFFYSLW